MGHDQVRIESSGTEKRVVNWGLAALVIYSAIRCLVTAASRPLWYDEMFTWLIAQRPGAAAIWRARGADSMPPFYHLVERVFILNIPNQEIALRLPSVIGFCSLL